MASELAKRESDFMLFEMEDERQIVNVHDFANDKKLVYEVRGNYELSYLAIKHLALIMATHGQPLETVFSQVTVGDDGTTKRWYAIVRVKNIATGQVTEGVSEAPYTTDKKEYDPFGRTKAHSKAERNALKKQMPERLITQAIEDAKNKGDVKKISSSQESTNLTTSQPTATKSDPGSPYCECPNAVYTALGVHGGKDGCGKLDKKFVDAQKQRLSH